MSDIRTMKIAFDVASNFKTLVVNVTYVLGTPGDTTGTTGTVVRAWVPWAGWRAGCKQSRPPCSSPETAAFPSLPARPLPPPPQVVDSLRGVLPSVQDQLCVVVDNRVVKNLVDPSFTTSDMALEITVLNASSKRVLLALQGERSLTPRPDGFAGGKVKVFDRSGGTVASEAVGINWTLAAAEKLLVLPIEAEWSAIAAKAAVV